MLIVGIEGTVLTAKDRQNLAASEVSGVILFARNYGNPGQLVALVASIRALRGSQFLISVDQEGGPVQRFRAGFTRLPPLARIGCLYRRDHEAGVQMATTHAMVMASELRARDVDLSFAPVLDLARGNRAIGERAFDAEPAAVAELGAAYVHGMRLAGMAATLKHFPGHGSVREDTHAEEAFDPRPLETIRCQDMLPFAAGINAGAEAVMVAHVSYPKIDEWAAGYSKAWIGELLRGSLGFGGMVFSDDVGMAAAGAVGGVGARVVAHLDAGCDLAVVGEPDTVAAAIASVRGREPCNPEAIGRLCGTGGWRGRSLDDDPQHARGVAALAGLAKGAIGVGA